MTEKDTRILTELMQGLTRQQELYQALREEVRQLRDLAALPPEEADVDALLKSVERKQGLFAQLQLQDAQLEPLRQQWQETRESFTEEERAPLGERVETLGGLMREIMTQEEKNGELLRQHSQAIGERLRSAQRQRQAGQAYGEQSGGGNPRFYDKKQ